MELTIILVSLLTIEELKIIIKRALQAHDLSQEVISLRHQLRDKFNFKNIIGKSNKIKEVLYKIEKVIYTMLLY